MAMKMSRPRKRYYSIAVVVLASLIIGLAAPFFFDAKRLKIDFESFDFEPGGVVAAPRDQFDVSSPLPVHDLTETQITSGRLSLVFPSARGYSGREAQALLDKGSGKLAINDGEIHIGGFGTYNHRQEPTQQPVTQAPIVTALLNSRFVELEIGNSKINVRLPGGYSETFREANLRVIQPEESSLTITGTAIWRGQEVRLTLQTGRQHARDSEMPILFKMDAPALSVKFSGALQRKGEAKLVGETEISIPALKDFVQILNVAWPVTSTDGGSLSLSGPLNWSSEMIAFERAAVRIDDNDANGALTIKRSGGLPLVSGTLAFDRLDLTSIGKPTKTEERLLPRNWWDTVKQVWSIPLVKFFDADLRLSAKEIQVGRTQVGKVAATLSLREGKLSAQLANLNYDGGSGSGQLTTDFNGLAPRTTVRGRLLGVPLGDLASTMFGVRRIEGRADVTLDLTAHGSELRAMLESMSGQVAVQLAKDGAVGLDLTAFSLAPLKSDGTTDPAATAHRLLRDALQGTTQITSLNMDVSIEAGRAECKKFSATFDDRVAKIAGRFDLAMQRMDVRALVHSRITADGSAGASAEQKLEGRRITLRGPWRLPHIEMADVKGRPDELAAALQDKWVEHQRKPEPSLE